ncbi:MAG: DUF2357 domain-containing protein [Firmicutes bacterium]|nr:DUF2357 domain-containing protein [Bacillota bacterium]
MDGQEVPICLREKRISFDTFENRFVKWIITQLMAKLRAIEIKIFTSAYQ